MHMTEMGFACRLFLLCACPTAVLPSTVIAQVAVELLKLTEDHGLDAWVGPTLNKKPFGITGVSRAAL